MSQAPVWMRQLVDGVAASLDPHGETGTVGYRYGQDGGLWEVVTYPQSVELGTRAPARQVSRFGPRRRRAAGEAESTIGFFLDLKRLSGAFAEVEAMQWFAFRRGPDAPEIVIEGICAGHQVLLRVLAEPPADDEETGLMLDTPEKGVTASLEPQ